MKTGAPVTWAIVSVKRLGENRGFGENGSFGKNGVLYPSETLFSLKLPFSPFSLSFALPY